MTHPHELTLGHVPRWLATLVAATVLAVLIPLAGTAQAVPDSYEGDIEVASDDGLVPAVRFAGDDRFETAGLIATDDTDFAADFDGDDVVLARSDIFPDALTGSRIGGTFEAPVLLTPPDTAADDGALNDDLVAALEEIDPETVYVLGGEEAIDETVTALVEDQFGVDVVRYAGQNRFETAALIADQAFDDPATDVETQTVIVSNGGDDNIVDALVSGAIGASSDTPILLTGGGGDLDPFTADTLGDLSADESVTVYVAGGPESLPDSVVDQIEEITGEGTAERVDGERAQSLEEGTSTNTRFATAVAFAELGTEVFGFGTDHVNLARGDVFADALALGPHAGLDVGGPAPIVLSANDALSQETADYFQTLRDCNFESLHLAGGDEALAAQVQDEAREALSGASGQACDIELTPETATNVVGETHTVTATLVDNTGETATALTDESGTAYTVDFTATPETGTAIPVPDSASVEVDDDGTADFEFTSVLPGDVSVEASFVNAEGETRTATATKTFVADDDAEEPGPGVLPDVTGAVTGANLPEGGTFAGDVENLLFSVNEAGDTILASGTLVGTVTGALGETIEVDEAFTDVAVAVTTPAQAAAAGITTQAAPPEGCAILNLNLGPLDLNLLGLQIDLAEVILDITAVPGAGNLLGNLLCAVAGLLDGVGFLAQIADLLQRIVDLISEALPQ